MSLDNYTTTINGTLVSLNDIFSFESANSNSSVTDQFKFGGSSALKGNSFSNAENAIPAITTWDNPMYDHEDRASDPVYGGDKYPYNWGGNEAIQLDNMGFDDKQRNVRYTKNGNDIGPQCCAKYIDYTAETGNIYFPTWVDYFMVIAVGEGGDKGSGRTHGDGVNDGIHAQGGTGSSGGFIAWKSKTNLGNVRKQYSNTYYTITTPVAGSIRFSIFENGSLTNWCQAKKGFKGATTGGNDGNDANAGNMKAAGHHADQSSLAEYQGGTLRGRRFITGVPSTRRHTHKNYSHNVIAESIYGWSNAGRGESWIDNNQGQDRGNATIRVYFIGYNVP